jgi:hypothetical protein
MCIQSVEGQKPVFAVIKATKALIALPRYINMRATLRQATKLFNLIFVWCSTSG